MTLLNFVLLFFGTLAAFLLIDLLWLGWLARDFYNRYIGFLRAPQTNWAAAIAFYIIFIVGILVFAIVPAVQAADLGRALLYGALYGFFTYATYDLTNLATLKDWPLTLSLVDIAWGTVLCTSVSWVGFLLGSALL